MGLNKDTVDKVVINGMYFLGGLGMGAMTENWVPPIGPKTNIGNLVESVLVGIGGFTLAQKMIVKVDWEKAVKSSIYVAAGYMTGQTLVKYVGPVLLIK